jgi:hypothetical protein
VASCAADSGDPSCWTQDIALCERHFCKVPIPAGGNYMTPLEENADFVGGWYNPAKVPGWGVDGFTQAAPRRATWAKVWLP